VSGPAAGTRRPGLANASLVDEQLAAACASGAGTVIADMSGTTFCDSVGIRVLVQACGRAKADGTDLRLLVSSRNVLRVMELVGVDAMLPLYPSIDEALAGGAVTTREDPGPDELYGSIAAGQTS
jgi:anti-sigma B factor antagonist